jgi:hypothetical protein
VWLFNLYLGCGQRGVKKLKEHKMRDMQLYDAISNARLNEQERLIAVTAMEKSEVLVNAAFSLVKSVRKLFSGFSPKPKAKYWDQADDVFGFRKKSLPQPRGYPPPTLGWLQH